MPSVSARLVSAAMIVAGSALVASAAMLSGGTSADSAAAPRYRAVVPAISAGKFPPTPTPTPTPVFGSPATLQLVSGGITMAPPIEPRSTVNMGGREFFDVPSQPGNVAWYYEYGSLGHAGSTTLMAGHINYRGYGAGPFAHLTSAKVGDALTVTDGAGRKLTFSVQSVQVISLANLDMNDVVYPKLGPAKERLTLISCGGTFVPYPSGIGGQYDSRVIVVTERYVD